MLNSNGDVGAFIKTFCELYKQHGGGAVYHLHRKRDVPLVKALLKDYDAARLARLAEVLLLTDDPWVAQTDRGIGILSVRASWLDLRLRRAEARR